MVAAAPLLQLAALPLMLPLAAFTTHIHIVSKGTISVAPPVSPFPLLMPKKCAAFPGLFSGY